MTASTALITGAGRGIGREVARTLASEGWRVLSGVRDPKSARPGTQPEVVDVADPESIEALAGRAGSPPAWSTLMSDITKHSEAVGRTGTTWKSRASSSSERFQRSR